MGTIYMYKGLPASGKDTDALERMRASNGKLKRVNKDMLREMLDNNKWSREREKEILNVRDLLIEHYLSKGYDVAVTDTNFAEKHWVRMAEIAYQQEAKVEIIEMSTPLVECLERNRKRENPVPERVIWDMYYKYILPRKVENIIYNPSLPDAIIVDVDGTLAFHEERNPFEYYKCLSDKVNEKVADLVRELSLKYKVLIVTGRENIPYESESVLSLTRQWLDNNQIPYDSVFIREEKDHRKDSVVKKEIWENYIKGNYNVVYVFDDRKRVIDMWRDEGLTVLDVAGHTF